MSIQFIPLGSPTSSSFAISASIAIASTNTPTTAALAAHAVNLQGPPGVAGITVAAISLVST